MDLRARAVEMARRFGIPEGIFLGLIEAESSWRTGVTSTAGAIGLTQVMPNTAKGMGYDPNRLKNDPNMQLEAGARYLKEQFETFGTWDLALAAYNAGPGNVRKHKGIPPFKETQNYVRKVMSHAVGEGTQQAQPRVPASPPTTGAEAYARKLRESRGDNVIADRASDRHGVDVFAGVRTTDQGKPSYGYTSPYASKEVNPILDRLTNERSRDIDPVQDRERLTQLPGRLPSELLDDILNLKRRNF